MKGIESSRDGKIATVCLARGKVNALNEGLVDALRECFESMADDHAVSAVILTGSGAFFSFGFDIPELYGYTKEAFAVFLTKFTGLYRYLFLYPKPIIAAINGHAIAGGCMLATTCDYRIMVTGKAKISLNEITFGASVFQGSVDLLRYCVGARAAQEILFGGAMYDAEQAFDLGLVHEICTPENLPGRAQAMAREFGARNPAAFSHMKALLRKPMTEGMESRDRESINAFIDIWYSDLLRDNLKQIRIRD